MKRKDFLKLIGVGSAALASIPSVLKKSSPVSETPYPKTKGIASEKVASSEIPITMPEDFRPGDMVRYLNKDGEYEYCVVSSLNNKLYKLDTGKALSPTKKELRTSQLLASVKKKDL